MHHPHTLHAHPACRRSSSATLVHPHAYELTSVLLLILSAYHVGSGFAHVGWYGHHFPPDQYGSDRSMALRLNGTTRLMCATTIEGAIIARSIVPCATYSTDISEIQTFSCPFTLRGLLQ